MVGLRDQINQKPGIAAGVMSLLIVCVATAWVIHFRSDRPSALSGNQMYFTADDGKTWFPDAWEKVPPIDHDGTQAVRCYVFKTPSSAPFAGYLETYTPAIHDFLTGARKTPLPVDVTAGTLLKRPGDKNWVPAMSAAGLRIKDVKAPDHSSTPPEPVFP